MERIGGKMQIWLKLKRRLNSRAYRDVVILRFLLVIPSGIGISLLFASGSYVQSVFTSFMAGEKSSLYEDMFGKGVAQIPSFGEYVLMAFSHQFLIAGLIVAIAVAFINSKRRFILLVSITASICLTTIDIINGAISTPEFLVSVLCNILAGILLALFSLTIVTNISIVKIASEGNKIIERLLWVTWPAIYYFALAGTIFVALSFLMKIPSSSVSLRVAPPMSGYIQSGDLKHCDNTPSVEGIKSTCSKDSGSKSSGEEFNVLSTYSPKDGSENKWVGIGDKLSIDWIKKNKTPLKLSLRMAQGCSTTDQLKKMLKKRPFYEEEVSGDSSTQIDSGLSQFNIISSDYSGEIKVSDKKPYASQFWVTPSTSDSSKLSVQRFIYNGHMHFTDQFKPLSYGLSLFPYGKKDELLKHRHITINSKVAKEIKSIEVKFDIKDINPNLKLRCEELKVTPASDGYAASATIPMVNLIVSVDHEENISYSDIEHPDELNLNGINGWVSNDGFERSRIDKFVKVGKTGGVSVFGAISDVQVNEERITTGSTSTLVISGDLSVTSDGPSIMIYGDADYMSLNDHRLTLTRWESLDTAIRAAVVFGIPTVLYFLLRLLGQALRKPVRHLWYLPR